MTHNLFPIIHSASDSIQSAPLAPVPGNSDATSKSIHPLSDELPYLCCGQYQEFGPLYLLSDDTVGFAFTLAVPVVDTATDAEEAVSEVLLTMLHALGPGVQWQWFFMRSTNVDPALRKYQVQPGQDAPGRLFADAIIKRWRSAQSEGFFPDSAEVNFHPRSQTIAVALKSSPLGLAPSSIGGILASISPWKLRARGRQRGPSAADGKIQHFIGVVRDILAAASAGGWNPTPIDAAGLVAWLEQLLFPQRLPERAAHGEGLDRSQFSSEIRTAIASLGRIEAIEPSGFQTVAAGAIRHHRIISMLWQPRTAAPGMLNFLASIRPNLNISIAASAQSPTLALVQIKARSLLNARSTHRFNETEMQARNEAFREVENRLFADGEHILELRLQVHVVESDQVEADAAAAVVAKYLQGLEMEAAMEQDIGSSLLLRGCLPFAVYPRTEQKLRRRRRMLSRDCADLHPAGGCWTGIAPTVGQSQSRYPSPIVMYSNSLGEPLFIDPTKADKNPHALVVGQSGSGKSFFVHDYLLHLWRLPDIRVFLLSIKSDYRKIALILGRYVDITLDSELSLNPFCGAPTNENQARWYAALELMLSDGMPSQRLARDAEVLLQGAALSAAQRNWDADTNVPVRETLLEHICLELERTSAILGRQLSARLHPYRKGPYSRLFNAPRGIHPSDRFLFFNLGNILRQPCAALTSFCVFGLIDETMSDPALRAVPKGLVADEVWALVRNDHAAAILERSLKAYRSLGGFAIPIVQDPQDLDSPSGRVMLVNTATKIILPMDRSGQSDLQKYVRLNDRELDIVRNLKLVKRRYSEFFVSIDGMRSAKGLLIPDPLRYAISTTDPVDEHQIETYFQESGSMVEAVQRFARNSPYGFPRDPTPSA